MQLTPTGWGYLGGGDNGLGQNSGVRGVAADPCPAGTTKQMLNGDGVANPGEDPNLLLSDYCVPCGPGVFCDPSSASALATSAAQSVQPQNCPAGTYGGVIGAKSVAGCIDCPIGTYQDMDGQFECLACAANTFASAPGSTSCQSCGDGFEVSTSGSNMCNPCKPGFYRDSAVSEKCLECPAGTSSGEGGWDCGLWGNIGRPARRRRQGLSARQCQGLAFGPARRCRQGLSARQCQGQPGVTQSRYCPAPS